MTTTITPAMTAAGIQAFRDFAGAQIEDQVARIYHAMRLDGKEPTSADRYEAMCKARDEYHRDRQTAGLEFTLELSSAYMRGYMDAAPQASPSVAATADVAPAVAAPEAGNEPAHTDHPLRHWDRTCPACIAEKEPTMPMLPNQHPGPRCSCRECLNRYPEGPWNECALSWCQDRMRCAHPLDGKCEAPEAGKEPSEALKLAHEWKGRGDDAGRLSREVLKLTEYVQRGCVHVLVPDAAVAVGAKSLQLSYFDKDTRQRALSMLTEAMSNPHRIQWDRNG